MNTTITAASATAETLGRSLDRGCDIDHGIGTTVELALGDLVEPSVVPIAP